MKSLKIRSLRRCELEEAWELHKEGFPHLDVISKEEHLSHRSKKNFDFDRIVVAVVNGKLVGKIAWGAWGKTGYFDGLVVDPEYRRRCIGTRLLREAEKRAMGAGMAGIDLGVKDFNDVAIALYEQQGYKKLHKVFFLKASKYELHAP